MSEFDNYYVGEAPPFAAELTQLAGGPVTLPQTADEFAAASNTLANVQHAVADSPGAQQYHAEMAARGVSIVVDQVQSLAETMGGRVVDRPAAYHHASELYDAALRAGDTPESAQHWALNQAAKKVTGKATYKDVADEFKKRTFGQTIEPQRKRDI